MIPKWLIGILLLMIIAAVIIIAAAMGFINIPGLAGLTGDDNTNSLSSYPESDNCDYTDSQILDMLEIGAGKELKDSVGISYVRALNMQACAVDDETPSSIISYYLNENQDWYLYRNDQSSGSGYTVYLLIWTNSNNPVNSTVAKSVVVVDGITVDYRFGHDIMILTSDGTLVTYATFLAWVNAS